MKSVFIRITQGTLLCLAVNGFATAQQSCIYPLGETDSVIGPSQGAPSATAFTMQLNGGGGDYTGWNITEQTASPGSNSCASSMTNPVLDPPTPGVSGGSWTVTNSINWGPDNVGFLPASVNYIRANWPIGNSTPIILNYPCGAQINQALLITCPQGDGVPYLYLASNPLTTVVQQDYVQNCRENECQIEYY